MNSITHHSAEPARGDRRCLLRGIGLALALTGAPLTQGSVILLDSFTAANGTAFSGRTPDVINVPGSIWTNQNVGDIQGNRARSGSDSSVEISLASSGGYIKPPKFRISADLDLNGMTWTAAHIAANNTFPFPGLLVRGVELGFFDDNTSPERRMGIGVVFAPGGQLQVVEDTVVLKATSTSLYPTNGSHNVSYLVDTTTGHISEVQFDGIGVSFDNNLALVTSQFTNAKTMIAGFYGGDDGAANLFGFVDNFQIESVPEPSTMMLLGAGGLLLLRRRR